MQAFRIVMLLVVVAVVYLLFLRSQAPPAPSSAQHELTAPLTSPSAIPAANRTQPTPVAHTEYKRDLDKAHDAVRQMQEQRAEADSL